jgi:hypothetical protein
MAAASFVLELTHGLVYSIARFREKNKVENYRQTSLARGLAAK